MKYKISTLVVLVCLMMAGCSGVQLPVFGDQVQVSDTQTPMPSLEFTATPTSLPSSTPNPTLTPTLTLTPTPTVFLTPTETPINFALAETGFDIADVRYSYPREDMLVVDFKYRIDERLEPYGAFMTVDLPRRCSDGFGGIYWIDEVEERTAGLYFMTRKLTGNGQIIFKMTLQGTCRAEGLNFRVFPLDYPTYPSPSDLYYEEYVLQPIEVTRSFPTMNLDMIQVRNFQFEPGNNWSGTLSFDYQISEEIPMSIEQYHFAVWDGGGGRGCNYSAEGPTLTGYSGTYSFQIQLVTTQPGTEVNCWSPYINYTYSETRLNMTDELANQTVLQMPINYSYTFWESY